MAELFVAGRRIVVGTKPDGTDDVREAGQPVPEAASWPNLRAYIATGQIRTAGTGYEPPPEPPASAEAQPRADAPVSAQEPAPAASAPEADVPADPIAAVPAGRSRARFAGMTNR